ncbi:MAG: hypothetical protein ABI600_10865 [Luteolibacter sp.]
MGPYWKSSVSLERGWRFSVPWGLDRVRVDHRRHLTESQRAMVAAAMANLNNGQRPPSIDGAAVTQAKAQELLKVGESSVTRAKAIVTQADDRPRRHPPQGIASPGTRHDHRGPWRTSAPSAT